MNKISGCKKRLQ